MFVVFVVTIAVSLRKPLEASRVSHYRKFIRIMRRALVGSIPVCWDRNSWRGQNVIRVRFKTNTRRVGIQAIDNTFYILDTIKYILWYLFKYRRDILVDDDFAIAVPRVVGRAVADGRGDSLHRLRYRDKRCRGIRRELRRSRLLRSSTEL